MVLSVCLEQGFIFDSRNSVSQTSLTNFQLWTCDDCHGKKLLYIENERSASTLTTGVHFKFKTSVIVIFFFFAQKYFLNMLKFSGRGFTQNKLHFSLYGFSFLPGNLDYFFPGHTISNVFNHWVSKVRRDFNIFALFFEKSLKYVKFLEMCIICFFRQNCPNYVKTYVICFYIDFSSLLISHRKLNGLKWTWNTGW